MNIFILDNNPKKAAQYHCDKHIPKMILESVQMLSTASHLTGFPVQYKATHKNHPCSIWVRESRENFTWLINLTKWLNAEYRERFGHSNNHKSFDVLASLPVDMVLNALPDKPLTPFAQAMPEQYRCADAVTAYRNYYLWEKRDIAKWDRSVVPEWWQ